MKFNFQIRDIILIVLSVILVFQFFSKDEADDVKPIQIIIPEQTGTTGNQVIERVSTVPVYIPQYDKTIEVDEYYKKLYEKADSLEKEVLYLRAIKINEYEKTLIDNDTIEIKGIAKTRGDLLEYKVDYKIKQSVFEYTPKSIYKQPSLTLGVGAEVGVPTIPDSGFLMKANVNIVNGKGNGLNIGYDTDRRIWLGVSKTFTIKK